MARQAIKSYAIDPAHTNDSHAIDRAQSDRLRIVSVCSGYYFASLICCVNTLLVNHISNYWWNVSTGIWMFSNCNLTWPGLISMPWKFAKNIDNAYL